MDVVACNLTRLCLFLRSRIRRTRTATGPIKTCTRRRVAIASSVRQINRTARQRFTVAHELAHVILERTGRNAPRTGRSVERVCDMLAAECLMPTSVFEAGLPTTLALSDIEHLSRVFDTSIPATAIRCTHFRRVCIFGVTGDRVTWGCGGIRRGAVMSLVDEVRDGVRSVMAGKQPEENVYFYDNGYRGGYHRFEWIHMGPEQYHDLLFA